MLLFYVIIVILI